MNRPLNFLINPKTGTELFFPTHLLPKDFFVKKIELLKPQEVRISRAPTLPYEESTIDLRENLPVCSDPETWEKHGLSPTKPIEQFKLGNLTFSLTNTKNKEKRWVISFNSGPIGDYTLSPFEIIETFECKLGFISPDVVTQIILKEKKEKLLEEISSITAEDITLEDIYEMGQMKNIIELLVSFHDKGWILGNPQFEDVFVKEDNEKIIYFFLNWQNARKIKNHYEKVLDLWHLFNSGNNNKFYQTFKPFVEQYLENPQIKKSLEQLNQKTGLRQSVPSGFVRFLEDLEIIDKLYLHKQISRCPEVDYLSVEKDNRNDITYYSNEGKIIQVKRSDFYLKDKRNCKKTLNYISLEYLYNQWNGQIAPKINGMDTCLNNNLDKCQENVQLELKKYYPLQNALKENIEREGFFKSIFGLVKKCYFEAHVIAISPTLEHILINNDGKLRLMGWNDSLVVNDRAPQIFEYSFDINPILFSDKTLVSHWAIDNLILYYDLIFQINRQFKQEKIDQLIGKLDNYFYPNVVRELVDMGIEKFNKEGITFWKHTAFKGMDPEKYVLLSLENRDTYQVRDLLRGFVLSEALQVLIGTAKVTVFVESKNLCLTKLGKEGWLYQKPKFLGSGSFGMVFQVCKEKIEKDCPYVFKIQRAQSKEQLDVNKDTIVYKALGENQNVAPKFYGIKVCPYVPGSFLDDGYQNYNFIGIGIYQKMSGGDVLNYLRRKIGNQQVNFEAIQEGQAKGFLSEPQLRRMAQLLEILHTKGIIHYDSKADNYLMDENEEIYISDFGASEKVDSEKEINKFYTGILADYSKLIDSITGFISNEIRNELIIEEFTYPQVIPLLMKEAKINFSSLPKGIKFDEAIINDLDSEVKNIKLNEEENDKFFN